MKLIYRVYACTLVLCLSVSCAVLKIGTYASEAFMSEPDPTLARDALPAMIKAAETMYRMDTKNVNNAVSVASLYIMYANAFLDGEAFLLPETDYEAKSALTNRSKALYQRSLFILMPFIEQRCPNVFTAKPELLSSKLAVFTKKDIPLLYWTAASILSIFSSNLTDFDNAGRLSGALALFERARSLDPAWNSGMLEETAVTIYASLPIELGGDMAKARKAFENALSITKESAPGVFVSYASAVCTAEQQKEAFCTALQTALRLPTRPESALMDTLAKRKASKLLSDVDMYF